MAAEVTSTQLLFTSMQTAHIHRRQRLLLLVILISQIKSDLFRWNLLHFLRLGHKVKTIKMFVLPRLLCLFQNIAVELPKGTFQELHKLISLFIWQGKKARICYKTLKLAKDKEGLPNIKNYRVVQIRTLVNICNPSYKAKWKDIECKLSSDFPLQAIIRDTGLVRFFKKILTNQTHTNKSVHRDLE